MYYLLSALAAVLIGTSASAGTLRQDTPTRLSTIVSAVEASNPWTETFGFSVLADTGLFLLLDDHGEPWQGDYVFEVHRLSDGEEAFLNCSSSGGASLGCGGSDFPAGDYSVAIQLIGTFDSDLTFTVTSDRVFNDLPIDWISGGILAAPVSQVPETSSLAMLSAGLLALVGLLVQPVGPRMASGRRLEAARRQLSEKEIASQQAPASIRRT